MKRKIGRLGMANEEIAEKGAFGPSSLDIPRLEKESLGGNRSVYSGIDVTFWEAWARMSLGHDGA